MSRYGRKLTRLRCDAKPLARLASGKLADQQWRARLGAVLREQRVLADLSIFELARRADVATQTLARLEGGHDWPSLKFLIRIADGLGVSLREVLP